jgi:hypothetical protein
MPAAHAGSVAGQLSAGRRANFPSLADENGATVFDQLAALGGVVLQSSRIAQLFPPLPAN